MPPTARYSPLGDHTRVLGELWLSAGRERKTLPVVVSRNVMPSPATASTLPSGDHDRELAQRLMACLNCPVLVSQSLSVALSLVASIRPSGDHSITVTGS